MSKILSTLILPCVLLASSASAFYLPGVAPTDYKPGEKVPLNVNRLTPSLSQDDQQLRSLVSYDYYFPTLHFCKPKDGEPKGLTESLGSRLFGDRIFTGPFDIYMAKNETCSIICTDQQYNYMEAQFVNDLIGQYYKHNWLVDGLPAATPYEDHQFYSVGFPLGRMVEVDQQVYVALTNHFEIYIDYHQVSNRIGAIGKPGSDDPKYRVVGVEIIPATIHSRAVRKGEDIVGDCSDQSPMILSEAQDATTQVTFTYSVYWRPSTTPWATRWDKYLHVYYPKIHWFSLINSTVIVFFLTGMVSTILLRALRKDIARYNQLDLNEEDIQEDSGWKLVHGDVFRGPKNPMLLSILLGSGAQLFFMTGATIGFAMLGFLSPSNRGSIGTVSILLYTLFGFIGGYVSARVYKTFGGESWRQNIIYTPLLVPGIVFSVFLFLNFFLVYKQSSGAVPFPTMLGLVALWFIISVPLSIAGSWIGFKKPPIQAPLRVNQIPRQIPPSATYLRTVPSMLMVGILPFVAIVIELYFIMKSIWFHQVYYMFGFLFLCYGIMIVTCAAVTILAIYFLLCSENYHWQWRSFFTAGATALYIFLFAFFYWVKELRLAGFTSNVLYLGYSALISFLFFILTGTVGYFSSWYFIQRIYSSIKID